VENRPITGFGQQHRKTLKNIHSVRSIRTPIPVSRWPKTDRVTNLKSSECNLDNPDVSYLLLLALGVALWTFVMQSTSTPSPSQCMQHTSQEAIHTLNRTSWNKQKLLVNGSQEFYNRAVPGKEPTYFKCDFSHHKLVNIEKYQRTLSCIPKILVSLLEIASLETWDFLTSLNNLYHRALKN
jgi:hypothetical protein